MRTTYSVIGGGRASSGYALTEKDLREILAAHFGFDPDTVTVQGIEVPEGEFSISGDTPRLDEEEAPAPRA